MEGKGSLKNYTLLVQEPYEGMAVFFVVSNDTDAKLIWGLRTSYDQAVVSGRKALIQEVERYEQSSRGSL